MSNLSNPIFRSETKARSWLEERIWPDGPVCPHCGELKKITKLKGKGHRPGLYQCNSSDCRQQFTATVGTIFERTKIPLNVWLQATYLLCSSEKGMSTRQLARALNVSVKSTWFMMHRIREAMREGKVPGGLGGTNKVVEVDETYVGSKAQNAKKGAPIPEKEPVISLVEREGKVRSLHFSAISRNTLRPILVTLIERKSYQMTDNAAVYKKIGKELADRGSVKHSIEEYVGGKLWNTNTVKGYFLILKRAIT